MTPQESRRLQEKAARLRKRLDEMRAKRPESDRKIEDAIKTLRELSGRA